MRKCRTTINVLTVLEGELEELHRVEEALVAADIAVGQRRLRRYWASGWGEGFAGRLRLAPKRRLLGSLPHDFDRRTDRPCGAVPLQLVIREGGDNPFVIDAIEVRP